MKHNKNPPSRDVSGRGPPSLLLLPRRLFSPASSFHKPQRTASAAASTAAAAHNSIREGGREGGGKRRGRRMERRIEGGKEEEESQSRKEGLDEKRRRGLPFPLFPLLFYPPFNQDLILTTMGGRGQTGPSLLYLSEKEPPPSSARPDSPPMCSPPPSLFCFHFPQYSDKKLRKVPFLRSCLWLINKEEGGERVVGRRRKNNKWPSPPFARRVIVLKMCKIAPH